MQARDGRNRNGKETRDEDQKAAKDPPARRKCLSRNRNHPTTFWIPPANLLIFKGQRDKADDRGRNKEWGECTDLGIQNTRHVVDGRSNIAKDHSPYQEWRKLASVRLTGALSVCIKRLRAG